MSNNPFDAFDEFDLAVYIHELVEAGYIDDLHRELALETSDGRNAWFEAKDDYGDIAGYVDDVRLAWQIVKDNDSSNSGQRIGLQYRYALMVASVTAMAQNIPPALLLTLVERRLWTPMRGLKHLHAQDIEQRRKILPKLIPFLIIDLCSETLEVALKIISKDENYEALAGLLPYMQEEQQRVALLDALAAIQRIDFVYSRAKALEPLLPFLPKKQRWTVIADVLDAAPKINRKELFPKIIGILAPYLQGEQLEIALNTVGQINNGRYYTEALAALAPYLREEQLKIALDSIQKFTSDKSAALLSVLAPHLGGKLQIVALMIAQHISDEYHRYKALTALLPYLPRKQRQAALAKALVTFGQIEDHKLNINLVNLVCDLDTFVPYLQSKQLQAVWIAVLKVTAEHFEKGKLQTILVQKMAPYLGDELLKDALAIGQQISYEGYRYEALVALLPYLPRKQREVALAEALAAARNDVGDFSRSKMLAKLVPYFQEDQHQAMIVHPSEDSYLLHWYRKVRDSVLVNLASLCETLFSKRRSLGKPKIEPNVFEQQTVVAEALTVVQQVFGASFQVEALGEVIPYLGAKQLTDTLAFVQQISEETYRCTALVTLAPYLYKEQLEIALDTARRITDEYYRYKALAALAPHCQETQKQVVLAEALTAARQIGHNDDFPSQLNASEPYLDGCSKAIEALSPYLCDELVLNALGVARHVHDENDRVETLAALVPYFIRGEQQCTALLCAFEAVRQIGSGHSQAEALIALAPYLRGEQLMIALLSISRQINDENDRAKALVALVPYLPDALLGETLLAGRGIVGYSPKVKVFTKLAPYLSNTLLSEVVEEICICWDDYKSQSKFSVELTPGLSDHFYEAQSDAFIGMMPHLSEPLLHKILGYALALAQQVGQSYDRPEKVLFNLLPHLPETLKDRALCEAERVVQKIRSNYPAHEEKINALIELVPHYSGPKREQILKDALAEAQRLSPNISKPYMSPRARALVKLAPHLPESERIQALQDAMAAIKTLPTQITYGANPQEYELDELRPYIEESEYSVEKALNELFEVSGRVDDLVALVPYLRTEQLTKALATAQKFSDRGQYGSYLFAEALTVLVPYLQEEQLVTVFPDVRKISDATIRDRVLGILAARLMDLPKSTLSALWDKRITLATRSRQSLLIDLRTLIPVLFTLGGEDGISETFRAIQDVGRWWP